MDKKRLLLNKTDIELDKDKLKKQLEKIVADFNADNGWQKAEEGIQTHFIIKLLELLGWNGSKNIKINETQDVKTGKKPDIILRDSGSKLLVIESKEAKNKNVLDGSYGPKTFIEQLFGYCRGEGLAWGVLTNFVEWRLYNEPQKCLYEEKKYAFHDLLWSEANKNSYIDLLSDEGLDFLYKLSKSDLVTKNGKIDVNPIYYPKQLDLEQEKIKKEFFSKIKNWRAKLKNFIHKNYASYSLEDVDLMAQEILDRMIFMDICHDKGVINENHIKSVLSATKRMYYDELKEKFKLMDEKFNTELFAPNECDQIKINNKEMEPIIRELDEINFAKLSVHIIGEVYENYLGELLKSSAQSPDKIKEKQKSKRKSQGIYYTPDYIVDYIVKNTIGELLKNAKTVAEIEKIRVLDPACGSGSFLIRAFDEFYNAYTLVKKDLGFDIKKKILQKNLFGVDLDERAVEITKLNLMIKALEGATVKDLEGKHLLPNLKLNIRCGNSLIGGEKLNKREGTLDLENYQKEKNELMEFRNKFNVENDNDKKKELLREIDIKEEFINGKLNKCLGRYFTNLKKVNPFNYTVAFCEIFKDGGFDAVIGNPPYVNLANIKSAEEREYLKNEFKTAKNKSDLYSFFAERTVDVLKTKGRLGFIFSNSWLGTDSFSKFREFLLNNTKILEMVRLPAGVFKDAMVTTILIFFEKGKAPANHAIKLIEYKNDNFENLNYGLSYERVKNSPNFSFSFNPELKIKAPTVKLGEIAGLSLGVKTSNDQKFILDVKKDDDTYKMLRGKDVERYNSNYSNKWIWYKPKLMMQKVGAGPRRLENFLKNKIMFRSITGGSIIATFDSERFLTNDKVHILFDPNEYSIKFILGIVNSRFIDLWIKSTFNNLLEIKINQLEQIPIPKLDFSKKQDKDLHDKLVKLVDEMLKLNKTPESREKNKTKIEAVDYEIDQLVYKLYGLNKEEINIIENK